MLHFTLPAPRRAARSRATSSSTMRRGARLCGARDLVVSGRLSAGADRRDGRGGRATARRPGRGAPSSSPSRSRTICAPASIRRRRRSSTARCSTTGRSRRRSRRSTAGRPTAQVDRRLVYIDPHPAPPVIAARTSKMPGFFATLRGAMSDIPSSQPVTDELNWVLEFNDQVRRLAAIIDSARPQVSQLVAGVITGNVRPADLDRTELRALARAGEFACRARRRFCLPGLCAAQARVGARLRRPTDRQAARRADAIAAVARGGGDHRRLGRCARASSTSSDRQRGARIRNADRRRSFPVWVKLSAGLRRAIPRAPPAFPDRGAEPALRIARPGSFRRPRSAAWSTGSSAISMVGSTRFGAGSDADFYSPQLRDLVADIFPGGALGRRGQASVRATRASFVEQHLDKIDRLIDRLATEINLDASTRDLDESAGLARSRPLASRTRGARCWSTISAFRSGTC